jgi:hypothetical protein
VPKGNDTSPGGKQPDNTPKTESSIWEKIPGVGSVVNALRRGGNANAEPAKEQPAAGAPAPETRISAFYRPEQTPLLDAYYDVCSGMKINEQAALSPVELTENPNYLHEMPHRVIELADSLVASRGSNNLILPSTALDSLLKGWQAITLRTHSGDSIISIKSGLKYQYDDFFLGMNPRDDGSCDVKLVIADGAEERSINFKLDSKTKNLQSVTTETRRIGPHHIRTRQVDLRSGQLQIGLELSDMRGGVGTTYGRNSGKGEYSLLNVNSGSSAYDCTNRLTGKHGNMTLAETSGTVTQFHDRRTDTFRFPRVMSQDQAITLVAGEASIAINQLSMLAETEKSRRINR